MAKESNLQYAYGLLNNRIIHSEYYQDLLYMILSDDRIKEVFKDNHELFKEIMYDTNFISELAGKLGKENDFTNTIVSSVKTNNALESIINVKFIETLYGNSTKKDLSLNDVLFTLLESIIGLDTIIASFQDRSIISSKVNEIMHGTGDFESLNDIIETIYNSLYNCEDYEIILGELSNYKDDILPYIEVGMDFQLKEIMNDSKGSYARHDFLLKRLSEIIPKINAKKM